MGKDVVVIAHAAEEQRGDETVDRIIAAGASKQAIYQSADLMGRIWINGPQPHFIIRPVGRFLRQKCRVERLLCKAAGRGCRLVGAVDFASESKPACERQA